MVADKGHSPLARAEAIANALALARTSAAAKCSIHPVYYNSIATL